MSDSKEFASKIVNKDVKTKQRQSQNKDIDPETKINFSNLSLLFSV